MRISPLIITTFWIELPQVDFGRDVEKQLNFYVECRRAFANLDIVKAHLVRSVANLAMTTLKIAKGKHTKESSAFVHVLSFLSQFSRLETNLYHPILQ